MRASVAILAAVAFVLVPALIRADGLIYPARGQFSDLTITHWPAFEYLRDSLLTTGAIPLWRTSILGGTPFAADPTSGMWYPPNWLSIVLPLEWFFKLIVAAHLFLGGWAMMKLAQSLGAGRIGAAAAGIAFAIAPRVIGHTSAGHITLVEAWAWMPLTVWAARQGRAIAAGAALGLCALADLRLAVYVGIVVAVYVLVTEGATRFQRVSYLALILGVAAWISAATWLPALSLAPETTRASLSLDEAGAFSIAPAQLLNLLLAGSSGVESTTHVGLAVLALALIGARGVWREQRRVAVWLIALSVIGTVVALGTNTPLYALLYDLPGMSLLRVPGRAWTIVAFAAALACGLGIDALMRRGSEMRLSKKWVLGGWVVGWFAFLFGLGGAVAAFTSSEVEAQRAGLSFMSLAIFMPLTIGLALARASGRLSPGRFGAIASLLIAIELIWVGWGQYRVVGRDEMFADGRAAAEFIASTQDARYRVYSPSYSLPQHVAQEYELELADGIDPLQLERTVHFMQRATGVGEWGYSVTLPAFEGLRDGDANLRTLLSGVTPNPALLGALNVKYIVAHFPIAQADLIEVGRVDGDIVYENVRWLPRAWLVGRVDVVDGQSEAVDWLESHDLREEAVVEDGQALSLNAVAGEVEIVAYVPDRIEVSARGPGLLVMSEVYERDWRASVDGAAARIYPTNGILRGVYLTQGIHRIEFVYDPVVVKVAVGLSGVGLVGVLGGWTVGWMGRRRAM